MFALNQLGSNRRLPIDIGEKVYKHDERKNEEVVISCQGSDFLPFLGGHAFGMFDDFNLAHIQFLVCEMHHGSRRFSRRQVDRFKGWFAHDGGTVVQRMSGRNIYSRRRIHLTNVITRTSEGVVVTDEDNCSESTVPQQLKTLMFADQHQLSGRNKGLVIALRRLWSALDWE